MLLKVTYAYIQFAVILNNWWWLFSKKMMFFKFYKIPNFNGGNAHLQKSTSFLNA